MMTRKMTNLNSFQLPITIITGSRIQTTNIKNMGENNKQLEMKKNKEGKKTFYFIIRSRAFYYRLF